MLSALLSGNFFKALTLLVNIWKGIHYVKCFKSESISTLEVTLPQFTEPAVIKVLSYIGKQSLDDDRQS